jgi:hypothetical protein
LTRVFTIFQVDSSGPHLQGLHGLQLAVLRDVPCVGFLRRRGAA